MNNSLKNNQNNNCNNFYQAQYPNEMQQSYPNNYLPYAGLNQPYQQNNQNYNQYWNYCNPYQQQQMNNYYQQFGHNSQYQPQQYHQQNNQFNNNKNFYNQKNQNNFQKNKWNNNNNNNNNGTSSNSNNFNSNNNNRNFNKNFQKSKKNKIDKRDLPENNKFYCEVCDRGFKTDEKYKEHCETHKTCGINGCKFTAAEKLVEIHFRNFHATGLDKKLSNLQTPDEIQKYINERKKNFPSSKNLEKKTDLEKEKSIRGISINTKQFGRLKNKNRVHSNQKANTSESNDQAEINSENDNSINEKENLKSDKIQRVDRKKLFKRRKNKKNNLFQRKAEVLKNRYKKPTLLQKLLADEIRHERNIILQCIRYIIQRNFFDKEPAIKSDPK